MTDETLRRMDLNQVGEGRYQAVNVRGGVLPIGSGDDPDFTPVELLLAALAGCTAIDVGLITGKRAQPEEFDIRVEGHKVRDDGGSHLVDLTVNVSITFLNSPLLRSSTKQPDAWASKRIPKHARAWPRW